MKKHIPFIDYWRIIATFYLVCFHTIAFIHDNKIYIEQNTQNFFGKGFIGTSFFMVLSGFIITIVYNEKVSNKNEIYSFWFSRLFRSYIGYLILIPIGIVSTYFLGNTIPLDEKIIPNIIANIFVISPWFPNISTIYIGPSWTLTTLYLFYLTFPFINLKNNFNFYMFFLYLFCFLPPIVYIHYFPDGVNSSKVAKTSFEYLHVFPPIRLLEPLLGMNLAYCLLNTKPTLTHYNYRSLYFLSIVFLTISLFFPSNKALYPLEHNVLWLPIILIILNLGYRNWETQTEIHNRKQSFYLTQIANDTLGVYLCHYFLITPIYIVLYKLLKLNIPIFFSVIIMSAINFTICSAIQRKVFSPLSSYIYKRVVPIHLQHSKLK